MTFLEILRIFANSSDKQHILHQSKGAFKHADGSLSVHGSIQNHRLYLRTLEEPCFLIEECVFVLELQVCLFYVRKAFSKHVDQMLQRHLLFRNCLEERLALDQRSWAVGDAFLKLTGPEHVCSVLITEYKEHLNSAYH